MAVEQRQYGRTARAFRRDKDSALRWKHWVEEHSELIVRAGLHSDDTESEDNWWDYLMHSGPLNGDYRWGNRDRVHLTEQD